jgi:hypothetical protein
MDRIWRERGEADGDVFSAIRIGCAVTHPLARRGDDGLAGTYLDDALGVLDTQTALQHDGDLFEFRRLSRLFPPGRRDHPRDAHRAMSGVDAAGEFMNLLRLVASWGDDGRLLDQARHGQRV